jgi:hypothetical protein
VGGIEAAFCHIFSLSSQSNATGSRSAGAAAGAGMEHTGAGLRACVHLVSPGAFTSGLTAHIRLPVVCRATQGGLDKSPTGQADLGPCPTLVGLSPP